MSDTLISRNLVPIIDLAGIKNKETAFKDLGQQLYKALTETGIALLINHGISLDKIQKAWSYFDEFLNLPSDVKNQYARSKIAEDDNHGYVSPGMERFDGKTPELRYAYNICQEHMDIMPKEVPGLAENISQLRQDFKGLASFILQSLAVAVGMPQNFFLDNHKHMLSNNSHNLTTLRMLYYPPVTGNNKDFESGQFVRCGAHCDYDSFTLLAQDSEGGLEIKLVGSDKWERVGHLPGAIAINCGETLSAWTQRRLYALPHRVIVPEDEESPASGRHSLAFFLHPDNDTKISPRDLVNQDNIDHNATDERLFCKMK
ncbi:gibberellin 20 oxidase 3 [Drosophila willistoni]|uniref:gibberellin 20 oxidase 3 n=1 Tax=Drosophila willistoni TaxID=7260 RepID=UPI00017D9428|nr:gibberellin 20 oxidase 3 [Drosophila willistoni]